MKINELDKQITSSDLEALETFADRIFGKVGIDVEFTRHFLDRVNDKRNGEQITASELTRLFKQEYKKWGQPIAQMGPDAEAVMKDLATDINMPFALVWDKENEELDLIVKTVMRKKDFKTSNREFEVESGWSMNGPSGLRHTPTQRSTHKTISLPLRGEKPLRPAFSQNPFRRLLKLGGVDEFTEDKDYNLIAQRKTMNLSDQAIIALIADLYKQLDSQVNEAEEKCPACNGTGWERVSSDEDERGCDECGGTGEIEDEDLKEEQLNEWIQIPLWAVATAVRVGGPTLIKLAKFGWKKIIKPGAVNTTKVIVQNPVKAAAAYGVYDVLTDVGEYVKEIKDMVGDAIDDLSIQSLAELAWKNKLPLAAVAAVLYGGSKLKAYMKDNPEDEKGDTTINNYYYGSEPATEGLNVQVRGSDPMPKAKPGRTNHPFIGKLVGSKYDEAKLYSFTDVRQKRIAIDTVKNPNKELLGGPSASEAEDILKTKFGYSDKQIANLKELNEELSIGQKQQRRRNRMNAHLQKTMKKYGDAEKAGIHPSRVNQRRTQMTVKKESRLSLYDTLMKMKESDIEEFEKDFSKLNEFTLVDVKDMIKKGWMSRPTEKQWKNLVKIYNKYNGNVTRKDLLGVGIASLGRKESVKEKQEKQEKTEPLIKAFDPKTARALMMLKAKYPQADNVLAALLADVENNEKDSDVTDLSQDYKMDKLTKEVDILQKEIKLLKRKQTNETGGVGKIVPGVNTSIDVGPDEIKKQAAKFGNDVDKDGVPKKNLR